MQFIADTDTGEKHFGIFVADADTAVLLQFRGYDIGGRIADAKLFQT